MEAAGIEPRIILIALADLLRIADHSRFSSYILIRAKGVRVPLLRLLVLMPIAVLAIGHFRADPSSEIPKLACLHDEVNRFGPK